MLALAEILRDEAEVLDALVDEVLGGDSSVELERLRELPVALAAARRPAARGRGRRRRPGAGVARRAGEVAARGARRCSISRMFAPERCEGR